MNFNVGIYPIYGILFGGNWSKTDYLDEEETEQKVQIALGILLVELTWFD
jgi:hypothetical protein